jgi:hypothetical protein
MQGIAFQTELLSHSALDHGSHPSPHNRVLVPAPRRFAVCLRPRALPFLQGVQLLCLLPPVHGNQTKRKDTQKQSREREHENRHRTSLT